MNEVDELKLLLGEEYEVTEHIKIRQPTLREIAQFGEQRYMSMLSAFVCSPFDMIVQLDEIGIDFTTITAYNLFCLMVTSQSKSETSILFGDTDFTQYILVNTKNGIQLMHKESVISEPVYNIIASCLRKMNNLAPPKYKKVGNELTKKKMIEFAYTDLRNAKRKKHKSNLAAMISAATNHPYFKYGINEVGNVKVYAFFDAIKRIGMNENRQNLLTAIYSGNIDSSKINKRDYEWLKETE